MNYKELNIKERKEEILFTIIINMNHTFLKSYRSWKSKYNTIFGSHNQWTYLDCTQKILYKLHSQINLYQNQPQSWDKQK